MRSVRRVLLAAGVMAAFAGFGAAGANADVATAVPDGLVEVLPGGAGGGGVAPMSTPMGSTFECNQPVVPVQAKPSGFVTGNCLEGVHLRRIAKSDPYLSWYWDGGYIFGNFAECGWVRTDMSDMVSATTGDLCGGSASMANAEFMVANNDATNEAVHGSCSKHQASDGSWRCTDGTPVQTVSACYEFANFRPWASGQIPIEPVRIIPSGYTLKWRYLAKYYAADGTGSGMVMVRDPAYSAGYANWVFVHASCLAGLPGMTTSIG